MTIKTINYVHDLLIENESKAKFALKITRESRDHAREIEAYNLETLEDLYKKAFGEWRDALAALQEFEEKEWN